MTPPIKAEWTIERTAKITGSLRVHMTAGPGGFTCEWDPAAPRSLTPAQLGRYRNARNQLLNEVGERMGGDILIIET
jgi:hypothetical protein